MEEDTAIQWKHCRLTWLPSISKQSSISSWCTWTHCNTAGLIVRTGAEMRSRRCWKSLLYTLVLMWSTRKNPKGVRSGDVLPETVVNLVPSSVLWTSHWSNYAQCEQSVVGRRPIETPPNPECCRQTIGAAGIAQACPGTMLTGLLLQQKRIDRKCAVGWGPTKFLSVMFQFHGDLWLLIRPYPAVVPIDKATGMKVSLITEHDVCQQVFID